MVSHLHILCGLRKGETNKTFQDWGFVFVLVFICKTGWKDLKNMKYNETRYTE